MSIAFVGYLCVDLCLAMQLFADRDHLWIFQSMWLFMPKPSDFVDFPGQCCFQFFLIQQSHSLAYLVISEMEWIEQTRMWLYAISFMRILDSWPRNAAASSSQVASVRMRFEHYSLHFMRAWTPSSRCGFKHVVSRTVFSVFKQSLSIVLVKTKYFLIQTKFDFCRFLVVLNKVRLVFCRFVGVITDVRRGGRHHYATKRIYRAHNMCRTFEPHTKYIAWHS